MNLATLLLLGALGGQDGVPPSDAELPSRALQDAVQQFKEDGHHFDDSVEIPLGMPASQLVQELSQKSASGDSEASYKLARIQGDPRIAATPADYRKSMQLLELSIAQDPRNAKALLWAGNTILEHGPELGRSVSDAVSYYQASSALGESKGDMNLFSMYFLGKGVEANDKVAFEHLTDAAKKGNSEAVGIIRNWPDLIKRRSVDRTR